MTLARILSVQCGYVVFGRGGGGMDVRGQSIGTHWRHMICVRDRMGLGADLGVLDKREIATGYGKVKVGFVRC